MNKIKIKEKVISEESKVFIVAEIGINHEGSIKKAKKLIKKAKESGANAVKFQTYITDLFIHKKFAPEQYKLLKKYELSFNDFYELKKFADSLNIIFFSSPFDIKSAKFLIEELKIPIIKIASSELTDLPLIEYVSKKKVPLFISTGLHYENEIKKVISEIKKINKKLVLIHCISNYPLQIKDANLLTIPYFKEKFNIIPGFSDHSKDTFLDIIAVSLGAKVIEKHFTLNDKKEGADHRISLTPSQFKKLVKDIRDTEEALGEYKKIISKDEKKIRKMALKGIYAKKDILKGKIIKKEDIITLRPVKNLYASEYKKIIGKKSKKNIKKGNYL